MSEVRTERGDLVPEGFAVRRRVFCAWCRLRSPFLTTIEEYLQRIEALEAENAALRAQVERLKAPVTDEELRAVCDRREYT